MAGDSGAGDGAVNASGAASGFAANADAIEDDVEAVLAGSATGGECKRSSEYFSSSAVGCLWRTIPKAFRICASSLPAFITRGVRASACFSTKEPFRKNRRCTGTFVVYLRSWDSVEFGKSNVV